MALTNDKIFMVSDKRCECGKIVEPGDELMCDSCGRDFCGDCISKMGAGEFICLACQEKRADSLLDQRQRALEAAAKKAQTTGNAEDLKTYLDLRRAQ